MGRRKGIPNKVNYKVPPVCQMTIEERLQLIANIIADRIRADLDQHEGMEVKADA